MSFVNLEYSGTRVKIPSEHRSKFYVISANLEGYRKTLASGEFILEATTHNLNVLKAFGFVCTQKTDAQADVLCDVVCMPRGDFNPPVSYFKPSENKSVEVQTFAHQQTAFNKFKDLKINGNYVFALFADMGTGKTKMAIDLINYHYMAGRIDAVLIVAKKGVHSQWVTDKDNGDPCPVKMFTQRDIGLDLFTYDGKPKIPANLFNKNGLKYFCINFDAIYETKMERVRGRNKKVVYVKPFLVEFLEAHKGRIAFVGDETHKLKNPEGQRTLACEKIVEYCNVRGILTGTPIASCLMDEWSQINLLSRDIIGHKYIATFKAEYCDLGGFTGRNIVGSKNVDRFKQKTEPYIYRVRKSDCIDLPEKIYIQRDFKLSPEQKSAIRSVSESCCFIFDDGYEAMWNSPASLLGKIQEISNGYISHISDEGTKRIQKFNNNRIDVLKDIVEDSEEKFVIFCRFTQDVDSICEALGDSAVKHYGSYSEKERDHSKEQFINNPKIKYFVATTASCAEGIDGFQKVCSTAIYYSNSFNSIERWQSEDRIHRIGMGDKAVYIDIIAKGCIDSKLLTNLRKKTGFAEMVLDLERFLYGTHDWD